MTRQTIFGWFVVALLGSTAHAQMPFPRDLLPTRTALGRVGLERQWMAIIPLTATERLSELSISNNLVFAQTNFANFYTIDAETGNLLWTTNLGHQTGDVFPAAANSKLVFLTNSNYLYALDRNTGRTVWNANLGSLPSGPVSCDEDYVAAGLQSGLLRGFDLREQDKEGNTIKTEKGGTILATRPIPIWNWQTNGPSTSPAIFAGKLVAFAAHDGKLYVALTESRTLLYRFATGGGVVAPMGIHDTRTMFIPSEDRNLYSVDLFTGNVNWTSPTGAPIMQQPLVSGDEVFVVNAAGILSSLDSNSGRVRWSISTHGGRLLSVSGTRIYLESHDDDLFIVERSTGRIVAEPRDTVNRAGLKLRPYELGVTNELNDRIYLGTKTGLIIGLREIGQTKPYLHRDPNLKPFGYIPPEGLPDTLTPPAVPTLEQPPADRDPAEVQDADTAPEANKEMPKEEEEAK